MGNTVSSSASSFYRQTRSVVYDTITNLFNVKSHATYINKSFIQSKPKITLRDVNRLLFNFNEALNKSVKKIIDDKPITKIIEIAYEFLKDAQESLTLDVNKPETIKEFAKKVERVRVFLDAILNNTCKKFEPTIRSSKYIDEYRKDKNKMLYDMSEIHTKELENEITYVLEDITETESENLFKLYLNSDISDETLKCQLTQTHMKSKSYRFGGAKEILTEFLDTVKTLFDMEIYYLEDKDHNGNPIKYSIYDLKWLRKYDYTGYLRRTCTTREEARNVISKFKDEHLKTTKDSIDEYFSELNNWINVFKALSEKLNIYYDNIICGSISNIVPFIPSLNNDDFLKIKIASEDNILKLGDYHLPSYTDFCTKISKDNLKVRLIKPPPPNSQVPGGNSNHPAQQDIINIWTVLGGTGDSYSFDNGNHLLFESDFEFEIDGAGSKIHPFINLKPEKITSIKNNDYDIEDEEIPIKIGPYYQVVGPLHKDISDKKKQFKREFFDVDLPVILSRCWKKLGYEIPVDEKKNDKGKKDKPEDKSKVSENKSKQTKENKDKKE